MTGALSLAACCGAAVPPALATGPTGDPATIALVRAIAANTNAQPAIEIAQSGYMTESSHVGTPRSFSFRWGFGGVPNGSVRATETITYTQLHGKVRWLTDVLRAVSPTCPTGQACPPSTSIAPIELFVTKAAAFAGVVDEPHGVVGCFEHESFKSVPYRAGEPWWSAVGDYRPKVTRGNQTLVTDTYSWADSQHVTEIDSINNKERLFSASVFHVARGPRATQVGFSFSQHDTVLAKVPAAPRVTRCS
ncbi:MAG TPA: hypothetical protein VMQ40_03135 [Acidimicrobiales bacterium]|nr:hypothetical protein [Acidimicrobiales bacterium]